jgi:hypothetical protein
VEGRPNIWEEKRVNTYLPEKKMPSTQAKATILSAKQLSLQKMISNKKNEKCDIEKMKILTLLRTQKHCCILNNIFQYVENKMLDTSFLLAKAAIAETETAILSIMIDSRLD